MERSDSAFFTVQAILAVALVAVGIVKGQAPLVSGRPAAQGVALRTLTDQVDARLWEDPLSACAHVIKSTSGSDPEEGNLSAQSTTVSARGRLAHEITEATEKQESELRILPVFLDGRPRAEEAEMRLRTRYAVVAALSREGYEPEDDSHIRFFQTMVRAYSEHATATSIIVPFEWWRKAEGASGRSPHLESPTKSALVLWINEAAVAKRPLLSVVEILAKLIEPKCVPNRERVSVEILGPTNSDVLVRILKEDFRVDDVSIADSWCKAWCEECWKESNCSTTRGTAAGTATIHWWPDWCPYWLQAKYPGLVHNPKIAPPVIRVLSALATVAIDELPFGINGSQVTVTRTTPTDHRLVEALQRELRERGIERADDVAIISEGDTTYGRRLRQEWLDLKWCGEPNSPYPGTQSADSVHPPVTYLRGLDGHLASGRSAQRDRRPDTIADVVKATMYPRSPSEESAGPSQLDFLRRLSEELASWRYKKAPGKVFPKAIGIFGSDVYDKLLILRALRPAFRQAIFFTTDLDARLLDDEEVPFTRNLILASPYPLEPETQGRTMVAPFRSSYQTATFEACLLALGTAEAEGGKDREARLFEIARGQVIDLDKVYTGRRLWDRISPTCTSNPDTSTGTAEPAATTRGAEPTAQCATATSTAPATPTATTPKEKPLLPWLAAFVPPPLLALGSLGALYLLLAVVQTWTDASPLVADPRGSAQAHPLVVGGVLSASAIVATAGIALHGENVEPLYPFTTQFII